MAKIKSGVPQRSALGPFLFNLFINGFFSKIQQSQVCSFEDDYTIYACGQNLESVASNLESDMKAAVCWYKSNEMVVNTKNFN